MISREKKIERFIKMLQLEPGPINYEKQFLLAQKCRLNLLHLNQEEIKRIDTAILIRKNLLS